MTENKRRVTGKGPYIFVYKGSIQTHAEQIEKLEKKIATINAAMKGNAKGTSNF